MSDPITCPNCGAKLGPGSPEALCPKCLIENAAWSQTVMIPEDAAAGPPMRTPDAVPPASQQVMTAGTEFGAYRILSLLGRGGMGAVYEAEQLETGRRVALKVLSHRLDSEAARMRFIREGRLAASINHPNSVYVFGTEEIEGTPTIAMEIVPGGNLQEKVVRDGPMPVSTAVDTILQLVSGLEAAQAIGILHRDVKPSNCFIDRDGAAKIGDFGLSISTEGRGDSNLTVQGLLLGTPAFASPEQLRGDELNARSDLYSVGATLYFLLTGEVPFKEANMIKLLARVLEEAPPDPCSLRPEIPRDLARIILRCLAKTPADRFKSYPELAAALQPYSSASPTPATLALRFGAYMIDTMAIGAVGFIVQALAWGGVGQVFNQSNFGSAKYFVVMGGLNLMVALYFGVLEGSRGASLGKKLFRLRLVDLEGNMAGIPRAFGRIGLLLAILALPFWLIMLLVPEWASGEAGPLVSMLISIGNLLLICLLFCAARRRNGYAGLHGLATGTRVVRAPVAERRPRVALDESSQPEPRGLAETIGPYHLIEPLDASEAGEWFLAYDTKLLRRVWIHSVADGTPTVLPVQRNHHRPGRLRWITGRRSEGENWDAYEAPAGMPLTELVGESTSWEAVRFWLLDLAEELGLARAEDSTPATLAHDRVWITADGHAKLLDFPAPGAAPVTAEYDTPGAFLRSIADTMLGACSPPAPLHTRALLDPAPDAGFESLRQTLRLGGRRPARVSRLRRLLITLGVSAFPAAGFFFAGVFMLMNQDARKNNPDLLDLGKVTLAIQYSQDDGDRENLRRFVAHRYRALVEDPETWNNLSSMFLVDINRQRLAREALAAYPSLPADEVVAAENAAASVLTKGPGDLSNMPDFVPLIFLFLSWITYAAFPSLLMALIIRRGLILTIFGTVVVDANGQRASRMRCIWRGLITWSPFLVGSIVAAGLVPLIGATATMIVMPISILALTILSLLRRDRSLQDRLAGTWLVPK